jgi:hypothetical protein
VKRFLVTILALLYLASVTGANLHMHYCMGVLVSWKLTDKHSTNKCSNCGMKSKKGCCEDKYKFVRAEKDQKFVEADVINFKAPVTAIDNPFYTFTPSYSYSAVKQLPCSHAPPYKPKVPVYISNCVFRI